MASVTVPNQGRGDVMSAGGFHHPMLGRTPFTLRIALRAASFGSFQNSSQSWRLE
jgi:hypothetical protein